MITDPVPHFGYWTLASLLCIAFWGCVYLAWKALFA